MFDGLEAIARESDHTGDDKEQLNVHIMTIGECVAIGEDRLLKNIELIWQGHWFAVLARKHAPLLPRGPCA